MNIENLCYDANVFFEGKSLYGLDREQILSTHFPNGRICRYALEKVDNMLAIKALDGTTIAEIIVFDKDDITILTESIAWQGNTSVKVYAYSDTNIGIECESRN